MELLKVIQNSSNNVQKFGPYTRWIAGSYQFLLPGTVAQCNIAWHEASPANRTCKGALSMLTDYFSIFWRIHLQTTDFSFISSVAVFGGECNETGHASFWVGMAGVPWKPVVTGCCCSCVVIEQRGEISLIFHMEAYFGGWSGSAGKSALPFWWCPPSRGKRSDESYKPEVISEAIEEWDVFTSLRSIRSASESLCLNGPLKYHQASSSFHSRTDQVKPDLHHSATEIKISVPWEKVVYATLWSMMGMQMRWTMGFFRCCRYQTLSWEYELIPDFPVHGISLFC